MRGNALRKIHALLITLLLAGSITFVYGFGRAQTATPAAQDSQRKTSEPYTGDLSIFDSPGREDRLQINRVMDLLGIAQ